MKINIYKNTDALSEAFTELLKNELKTKELVNVSLSGGSTPKALFNYWAENGKSTLDWHRVSFYWGDERCVPPDDEMSNFGMTKALLFDKIESIDRNLIHRIHGENEPKEECVWYEKVMDEFLPKVNDIPCFDIMMLGMGDDGHTVSIFPHQISLWDSEQNALDAVHPDSGMVRVSLTGRIVNNAHNIVFLVTGKSKAEKVKQIIEQRQQFENTYPAAKVNPTHGNVYWFLDEDAASLL
ncbi:MAG: 6-phosphogluconolactonase [Bacteroidota bacterium]|jgi:6-phosphogluconolactonase